MQVGFFPGAQSGAGQARAPAAGYLPPRRHTARLPGRFARLPGRFTAHPAGSARGTQPHALAPQRLPSPGRASRAGELGDGLGALGHGVLGQLACAGPNRHGAATRSAAAACTPPSVPAYGSLPPACALAPSTRSAPAACREMRSSRRPEAGRGQGPCGQAPCGRAHRAAPGARRSGSRARSAWASCSRGTAGGGGLGIGATGRVRAGHGARRQRRPSLAGRQHGAQRPALECRVAGPRPPPAGQQARSLACAACVAIFSNWSWMKELRICMDCGGRRGGRRESRRRSSARGSHRSRQAAVIIRPLSGRPGSRQLLPAGMAGSRSCLRRALEEMPVSGCTCLSTCGGARAGGQAGAQPPAARQAVAGRRTCCVYPASMQQRRQAARKAASTPAACAP